MGTIKSYSNPSLKILVPGDRFNRQKHDEIHVEYMGDGSIQLMIENGVWDSGCVILEKEEIRQLITLLEAGLHDNG